MGQMNERTREGNVTFRITPVLQVIAIEFFAVHDEAMTLR